MVRSGTQDRGWTGSARRRWLVLALVGVLAACASGSGGGRRGEASPGASRSASSPAPAPGPSSTTSASPSSARPDKVMVIAEENKTYGQVLGAGTAPFLDRLAAEYATLTRMDAGYAPLCPSLPAYLLMTSGSTHDVCDDADPRSHPIDGPSIFTEVEAAGLQWRGYAESMPGACTPVNVGRYLVRHAPAPYYTAAAGRCTSWDLPLGTPEAGALHDDVAGGRLPAYSFVTPDACDDMHGGPGCTGDLVAAGDDWLARWLPQILAGPDFRDGRLLVVITWDEGSSISNHIPTVVVGPTAHGVRVGGAVNHCGLLALEEDLLSLPLLGCARTARSPATALGLPA